MKLWKRTPKHLTKFAHPRINLDGLLEGDDEGDLTLENGLQKINLDKNGRSLFDFHRWYEKITASACRLSRSQSLALVFKEHGNVAGYLIIVVHQNRTSWPDERGRGIRKL